MACGPCTFLFASGKVRVQCSCRHGVFNIQSNTAIQGDGKGDGECQECAHPLSLHEDINSSALTHTTITSPSKVDAEDDFKAGIKYKPPLPLVKTSGKNWIFQPHPELYETLATNVLENYAHYKKNNIDETYIPTYFYLGGAGTGKSRHASEFATSVQKAITNHTQHPLYHDLAQRLEKPFVFHVSFENGTPLTVEERSNPWNAIGVRMLHQLLDKPIDYIRSRYVAEPSAVFRLVAAAENVDLYDDLTGILVVDGIQKVLAGNDDGKNKSSTFYGLLSQIGSLSLMSRRPSETKGRMDAPFIITCVTATYFGPI